jgi:DNA replication factor GINS
MDLDQLQSVRDRERGADDLQELRESFYADAIEFVNDLRAERKRAAGEAAEPFDSPRVNRLTDRIQTAEQTLEAIYEKRVGKVVKAATFAAADLPAEAEGMTAEEAELFETLVAAIRENREQVLGQFAEGDEPIPNPPDATDEAGAASATDPATEGIDRRGDDPGAEPTDLADRENEQGHPPDPSAETRSASEAESEGGSESTDAPEGGQGVERERVLITDDVGAILGVDDREYDLAADDVVRLPAANAEPLIEQGVAERLE